MYNTLRLIFQSFFCTIIIGGRMKKIIKIGLVIVMIVSMALLSFKYIENIEVYKEFVNKHYVKLNVAFDNIDEYVMLFDNMLFELEKRLCLKDVPVILADIAPYFFQKPEYPPAKG